MITKDAYQELSSKFAAFGKMNDKLKEIIRDELSPSEEVGFAKEVKVYGVDGMVCVTQKSIYAFWTQKMFIFFKLPAVQTFHLEQIRQLEPKGSDIFVRAEADPAEPDEDYEENTFSFGSAAEADEFYKFVGESTPLKAS